MGSSKAHILRIWQLRTWDGDIDVFDWHLDNLSYALNKRQKPVSHKTCPTPQNSMWKEPSWHQSPFYFFTLLGTLLPISNQIPSRKLQEEKFFVLLPLMSLLCQKNIYHKIYHFSYVQYKVHSDFCINLTTIHPQTLFIFRHWNSYPRKNTSPLFLLFSPQ